MGWRDITVIYGHDTISLLYSMMLYCAKLTGEDLSRYLNKKKSLVLVTDWRSDCKCCKMLTSPMAARTAGIDKNEESMSQSPYVYMFFIELLISCYCYGIRCWTETLLQTYLSVSQWELSFGHLLTIICHQFLLLAALTSLLAMVYKEMKLNTLQKLCSRTFRYAVSDCFQTFYISVSV